jgi:hypothetical protein
MMFDIRRLVLAAALLAPAAGSALAQSDSSDEATQIPLSIGGLQLAAHPNLKVEKIDVSLSIDKVVATYNFRNTGASDLVLAASIAMPPLQASPDGSEVVDLPVMNAENPLGLTISANGAPVPLKPDIHAYALGIDRIAEIRAERLPLIPFGPESEKALSALRPDAVERLATLGILSPRDPQDTEATSLADWELSVTYAWMQRLPAGRTTTLTVSYKPIKATYTLNKENMAGLEELKEATCPSLALVQSLSVKLAAKNTTLKLTDFILPNAAPVRWIDSPEASIEVAKPTPDANVIFCGIDQKTANLRVVSGKIPDSDKADNFRVLMFGSVITVP